MSLQRKFEQRLNTPAKPQPLPLALELDEVVTACPACSVAIRPGAVLCIRCGARIGRIDTVAPTGFATRAPCPNCDYDLSGVSATTCPECGGPAPFSPAPISTFAGSDDSASRRSLWEACRNSIVGGGFALIVMVALAGAWYGPKGVGFWLATIAPTWIVASAGYFAVASIMRFIDTTIPIAMVQVLGVVLVGLTITQLAFPSSAGGVSIGLWGILLVPAVVTAATMLIMDDDDRVDSFLASLPIALACASVPAILRAIVV